VPAPASPVPPGPASVPAPAGPAPAGSAPRPAPAAAPLGSASAPAGDAALGSTPPPAPAAAPLGSALAPAGDAASVGPSSPSPMHVALVVGTTSGGTGAHVRMLAEGLAGRGIGVSVLGPSSADAAFGFGALDGVSFAPVEFGDRPRARDAAALLRLRRLLSSRAGQSQRPDVVHAHGLRAGALTVLAIVGVFGRSGRRPGLVVTVHNAPPTGARMPALVYRLLERLVARGADLVLCVSADLEARMQSAGARRTARAIVPSPSPAPRAPLTSPAPPTSSTPPISFAHPCSLTTLNFPMSPVSPTPSACSASLVPGESAAAGPPLVLAVGRLAAQKGFDVLLDAAVHWRDLDPAPLLAIAGDGPLAGELRLRAASIGLDAVFLGRRDDVPHLLAAAAVFVLPSRWEGQPLIVQEALRAGAPIVATRVGGIPDLVGDDAAVLVAPGDAPGLAAAVRAVVTDASLANQLRAAAARRAAALPTADDAVAAALAAYAQVLELT
jgi:glycosyltransferase involved in cell wall biosynthesis